MHEERVFRTLVLPILLYSCETRTVTGGPKQRLNFYGTSPILGYWREDHVLNDSIPIRLGCDKSTDYIGSASNVSPGAWDDSLRDHANQNLPCRDLWGWIMPEIHMLRGCVKWSPIWWIQTW